MTPISEQGKPYRRGTYSKIARKLGVTPQSVRLVAIGMGKSKRISAELRREERNARRRAPKAESAA